MGDVYSKPSLLLVAFLVHSQPQHPVRDHAANPKVLVSLMSKDRNSIEKILGSALKSRKDDNGGLICEYPCAGTKGVQIYYWALGGGLPPTSPGPIEVSLEDGATWQSASTLLGLKPKKLTTKPYLPGLVYIVGHPYRNYNVLFANKAAKYPDGTLVNPNRGLTMISINSKSINE